MEEIEYDIWLRNIKGIGNAIFYNLVDHFGSSKAVWDANKDELIEAGIKEEIITQILSTVYRNNIEKILKRLNKENILPISKSSNYYPKVLKKIKNAPAILYLKGNKEILNDFSIGIVGSRNCSEYGKQITEKFAFELAQNGITIISGMALGIDTFAHIGALNANGKTIAVLGNGFDYIYPAKNKTLFYEILKKNGSIITEYLPEEEPFRGNFLARNRIISGMSKGIIVSEANQKSGALVTVNYAFEQKRKVFCIPGNINNSYNKGRK